MINLYIGGFPFYLYSQIDGKVSIQNCHLDICRRRNAKVMSDYDVWNLETCSTFESMRTNHIKPTD